MEWEKVVKWLGMICIAAGIARMGMTPSALMWGTDSVPELTFGFIACVLMSVGTIATYLVQSRETGIIGFITTLSIIVANIIVTAMLWTLLVLGSVPEVDGLFFTISRSLMMTGMLGMFVFTFISFRAKVFPRWVIALQMLMHVSTVFDEWFALFWGLAYVGMGFTIWTGKVNSQSSVQVKA